MPRRRALLAGLGAASASLAGCNVVFGDDEDDGPERRVPGDWTPAPGEWANPRYDLANSGYNPHASPPGSEPSVAWEVDAWTSSVLVADGTVFLRDGVKLHGYDAEDGDDQFDVSLLSGSLHQYVEGRIYDRNLDGLDALTLEGEPAWDEPIEYEEWLAGVVERDGYVFISTGTDTIHHHDADTGERVDATVHEGAVRGLSNRDGVLYAALADGLATYDVADDGSLEERWRHRIDDGSELEPRSVVVGPDRAYLVRRRGRNSGPSAVDVFDVADESRLGTLEFERRAVVAAVDGEYAYVGLSRLTGRQPTDGELRAYDGTEDVWSADVEPAPVTVAGGGVLCVGSSDIEAGNSRIVALDATSGDALWTYAGAFPLAVVGETVYATTDDERFVALRD